MPDNPRAELFDSWSGEYDRDVSSGEFPFVGYAEVLETVLLQASLEPGMSILELGPGTGILTGRLVERGCRVLAMDFSEKMIELARERVPRAQFVQGDLLAEWPAELRLATFDRILSTYLFHEFQQTVKIQLLSRLARRLTPDGWIVIGDLAFPDAAARNEARIQHPQAWDEEDQPWAAVEDLKTLATAGLGASYTQVSVCGGVVSITPGEMPAISSS